MQIEDLFPLYIISICSYSSAIHFFNFPFWISRYTFVIPLLLYFTNFTSPILFEFHFLNFATAKTDLKLRQAAPFALRIYITQHITWWRRKDHVKGHTACSHYWHEFRRRAGGRDSGSRRFSKNAEKHHRVDRAARRNARETLNKLKCAHEVWSHESN